MRVRVYVLVPVLGQERAVDAVHEVVEAARHVTALVARLRAQDARAQLVEELTQQTTTHGHSSTYSTCCARAWYARVCMVQCK